MPYKLQVISNGNKDGWNMPEMDFTAWRNNNVQGVYIPAGAGKTDNTFIEAIYDKAVAAGMRVGFYRILDEVQSYYKQMDDLRQKSTARSVSLPPALIVGNIIDTNSWLWRQNFTGEGMGYFETTLLSKFATVVLAFNPSTLSFVMSAGQPPVGKGDNLELFKLQAKQARLWYWKLNGPLTNLNEIKPWTAAWILTTSMTNHTLDDGAPTNPPVEPPVVPPATQTKNQKIAALLQKVVDELNLP
jgi:hypothetical protein